MLKRQIIPECSHRSEDSYVWPKVMNNVFSTVKSLHSTLYTV